MSCTDEVFGKGNVTYTAGKTRPVTSPVTASVRSMWAPCGARYVGSDRPVTVMLRQHLVLPGMSGGQGGHGEVWPQLVRAYESESRLLAGAHAR